VHHAICGKNSVVIPLAHTFIGVQETLRLCASIDWLRLHPQDPDKAVYANRLGMSFLKKGLIPLSALNCEVTAPSYPSANPSCWIFAGCGGMGLGFQMAGFHVNYMVEKNSAAAATLRYNHLVRNSLENGDASIFEEDVALFLDKVEQRAPCYPKKGDPDHIHGSPPCQGVSAANRNGGKNDQANNECTFLFPRAVEIFRPRSVSMENVTGMLFEKNERYPQGVVAWLMSLGYQVRLLVLDASEYGDPQARKRIFLFGALMDSKLADKPAPTHGKEKGKLPFVTVKDVLQVLEDVEPVLGSGRVMLKSGTIVSYHNVEGTVLTEIELLDANKPAATVRRRNGIQHYLHGRSLSVRERARLQSFPDYLYLCGRLTERNNQIGNAVPFNLAFAVAQVSWSLTPPGAIHE